MAKGYLDSVDLEAHIDSEQEYEARVHDAQVRMLNAQLRLRESVRSLVIVLEGWDAAGKGGVIKVVTSELDPRYFRVHAIAAPTPDEKARHHLWRFLRRLPAIGEIVIFDRSWYGRPLVERIEGFCSEEAWRRSYREINEFERWLVEDGTILLKFFLHIDKDEQLRRFHKRERNPLKRWKIGPEDWRNREKWDEYEHAIEEVFSETDTEVAPWTLIAANSKRHARVRVVEEIADRMESALGIERGGVDPSNVDWSALRRRAADHGIRLLSPKASAESMGTNTAGTAPLGVSRAEAQGFESAEPRAAKRGRRKMDAGFDR